MLRDLLTTALRDDPDPHRPPPAIPLARDDLALLGLVDLVVDHEADEALLPVLKVLAGREISLDLYHYLVSAVVARRRPPLVRALLEHAETEMRRDRLQVLVESLALVPGGEVQAARDELERRLAARGPVARPED